MNAGFQERKKVLRRMAGASVGGLFITLCCCSGGLAQSAVPSSAAQNAPLYNLVLLADPYTATGPRTVRMTEAQFLSADDYIAGVSTPYTEKLRKAGGRKKVRVKEAGDPAVALWRLPSTAGTQVAIGTKKNIPPAPVALFSGGTLAFNLGKESKTAYERYSGIVRNQDGSLTTIATSVGTQRGFFSYSGPILAMNNRGDALLLERKFKSEKCPPQIRNFKCGSEKTKVSLRYADGRMLKFKFFPADPVSSFNREESFFLDDEGRAYVSIYDGSTTRELQSYYSESGDPTNLNLLKLPLNGVGSRIYGVSAGKIFGTIFIRTEGDFHNVAAVWNGGSADPILFGEGYDDPNSPHFALGSWIAAMNSAGDMLIEYGVVTSSFSIGNYDPDKIILVRGGTSYQLDQLVTLPAGAKFGRIAALNDSGTMAGTLKIDVAGKDGEVATQAFALIEKKN